MCDYLKVVTKGIAAFDDLLVQPSNDVLLLYFATHALVELAQPRLAVVVDDENPLDHYSQLASLPLQQAVSLEGSQQGSEKEGSDGRLCRWDRECSPLT